MKRVLRNKRKNVDRRKLIRSDIDRRTVESQETEYVSYPISESSAKRFYADDFEESCCERMIVEHPVEKIMLTILKDVDYMGITCLV